MVDVDDGARFDADVRAALERMGDFAAAKYGISNKPQISMVTVVCQLAIEQPASPDQSKALDLNLVRELCAKHVRKSKSSKKYKDDKKYQSFYNSVTLVFGSKAVKVFSNGKLHITGCKSVTEAETCAKSFLRLLMAGGGDDDVNIDEAVEQVVYSTRVLNINCCVRTRDSGGTPISLEKLQQKLQKMPQQTTRRREEEDAAAAAEAEEDGADIADAPASVTSTRYNPDIYQALVAKVRCEPRATKDVSALIFYTGTVMITGARRPADIEKAFELVCEQMMDKSIEL